jgi:type I restriction enzyme S subunit
VIADLKHYPAYKDSGLPWAKEVPEHWNLIPNRALIRKRKILVGDQHTKYQLLSLTKEGVIVRDIESGKGKFSADMGTSQEVRAGDLIFCFFDIPETPRTVGLSHHNGMITGAYTVFESSDPVLSAFLELFHKAMDDRKLLSPLYSGLRNTIHPTRFLGIKTPVPPHDEQLAIVRFLEYMDRRIRRYIRTRQKLIKLLEEQKQAIIHRAVTRGLDPNVPLKPSGVEWLGDVPEHWEVMPFAKCAVERSDYRGATPEKVESGVFLVTAKNIRMGWIDYETSKEYVREDRYNEIMRRGLPKLGDLLLTTEAPLGHVAPVDREDVALAQRIIRFRMDDRVMHPKFALYSILSPYFQLQLQIRATGSTAKGIKASKLPQLLILKAPTDEQKRIVIWIEGQLKWLNSTIDRTQRQIEFMHEYRTRLISDVVTGKLDVRGLDLPAADDAEVPEEFSDLLESEAVLEEQETQEELPAEAD